MERLPFQTMKISLFFLLLSEVPSVESKFNRLGMFTKHHAQKKTYIGKRKERKQPQLPKLSMKASLVGGVKLQVSKATMESKLALNTQLLEATSTPSSLEILPVANIQLQVPKVIIKSNPAASIKLLKATPTSQTVGAFERICTSQTCNKCYKLILIGRWESTKKHIICQKIITTPNCCESAPLRSYFWSNCSKMRSKNNKWITIIDWTLLGLLGSAVGSAVIQKARSLSPKKKINLQKTHLVINEHAHVMRANCA